jgi:hypothetical protein
MEVRRNKMTKFAPTLNEAVEKAIRASPNRSKESLAKAAIAAVLEWQGDNLAAYRDRVKAEHEAVVENLKASHAEDLKCCASEVARTNKHYAACAAARDSYATTTKILSRDLYALRKKKSFTQRLLALFR